MPVRLEHIQQPSDADWQDIGKIHQDTASSGLVSTPQQLAQRRLGDLTGRCKQQASSCNEGWGRCDTLTTLPAKDQLKVQSEKLKRKTGLFPFPHPGL